ncbi:MAG TPA: hypothetical protein VMU55_05415 [Solirubrobacteraceae bacterium]|nr:hypothetical protein [Solirubrobacteraceae bacterium]
MNSDFDTTGRSGEHHRLGFSVPQTQDARRDDVLQDSLADLNRRLRELTEDLTRPERGATDPQAESDASQPPRQTPGRRLGDAQDWLPTQALGATSYSEAERPGGLPDPTPTQTGRRSTDQESFQRTRSIVDSAQRMADEIVGNAHQQVASARQQIASVHQELQSAREQAARTRKHAQELLMLGEQLLTSARRVFDVFEGGMRHVQSDITHSAGQAAHRSLGASRPEPASVQTRQPTPPQSAAFLIDEHPHLSGPPTFLPLDTDWSAVPAQSTAGQQGSSGVPIPEGPRAGVYAPPTQAQEAVAPLGPATAPPAPIAHVDKVMLTAGPLADVATAAVLERALERIPAVAGARVKRFVDGRVSIELHILEAVMLTDELGHVLPYPFEVQAVTPSEIDIAIVAAPERVGGLTADQPEILGE